MDNEEILQRVTEMVAPHGLRAEIFPGIFSVGVQGDDRTYTPVVNLIGPHPGNDVLATLGTRISNELPINRVTFEIACT